MKNSVIKPNGDRVVMRVLEEDEQIQGGIIIPDQGGEAAISAEVIAVGPGRLSPEGILTPMPDNLVEGAIALIPLFGAQKVKLGMEEYVVASANDILGTVETQENE